MAKGDKLEGMGYAPKCAGYSGRAEGTCGALGTGIGGGMGLPYVGTVGSIGAVWGQAVAKDSGGTTEVTGRGT